MCASQKVRTLPFKLEFIFFYKYLLSHLLIAICNILFVIIIISFENSRNQSSSTSRTVLKKKLSKCNGINLSVKTRIYKSYLWKKKFKCVINAHQLTDTWMHNVLEMGMVPKIRLNIWEITFGTFLAVRNYLNNNDLGHGRFLWEFSRESNHL